MRRLPLPLQAASAITYDELQALSYKEVKGSGLSNQCPAIRWVYGPGQGFRAQLAAEPPRPLKAPYRRQKLRE